MNLKKLCCMFFVVSILIVAFSGNVSAAITPAPFSLDIPKAITPPTLDGNVDVNGEWKNAWHAVLDSDKPGGVRIDTLDSPYRTTYDFYMMWDETNLYVACVAKGDKTVAPIMNTGLDTRDNNIRGDGFQLFINPGVERGKDDKQYFWSDFYCEYAAGVTPFWWEYSVYDGDNNDEMANKLNISIAPKRNGDTWTIEICIPWEDLLYSMEGTKDQFAFKVPMTAGKDIKIEFASMDFTGDADVCRRLHLTPYDDGEDMFTVENFYTFKTSTASAGVEPIVESPAVAEVVNVAAADTTANVPAPAVVNVLAVPNTFDPIMAYIIVGAISSIVAIRNHSRK